MDNDKTLWKKCVEFHGHVCGGLMIGYKAALRAMELLELRFAEDEEVVCVAENDACGIDAIQVLLGCTVGKSNLLFHLRGKQAWTFYHRATGKAVRLVLKDRPAGMTREEGFAWLENQESSALFDVKEPAIPLPEHARIFESYPCACCGETTGANWIRILDGKMVCQDCYSEYDRFHI